MYLKVHDAGEGRIVVALCDKELVGKTLKEDQKEIRISESFYKGEELPEEKIKKFLEGSPNLNIFGEKAIKLAIDCNIIDEDSILRIEGVPHAQIFA